MGSSTSKTSTRPADSAQHGYGGGGGGNGEGTNVDVVWQCYVSRRRNFFDRAYERAIAREPAIGQVLGFNSSTNDERKAMIRAQSQRVYDFIKRLMELHKMKNESELFKLCYDCGGRHATYSNESFKSVYWDVFLMAMTEELEASGLISDQGTIAWQRFLNSIVDKMRRGYEDSTHEAALLHPNRNELVSVDSSNIS